MKKFMLRVMPIIMLVVMMMVSPVYALQDESMIFNPSGKVDEVNQTVNNIWGTVLLVLRILAVAAIVFAGVKYMFASAEGKADLKNGMVGLVIGAILVFGASIFVEIIMKAAGQI